MTNQEDPLGYRPCAGIVLINKEGKVFVGQRADKAHQAHQWQLPQGGIDKGESPQEAALRELHEETSIQKVRVIAESSHWHSYEVPLLMRPKFWAGQYRGQTQKWFLMLFEGKDHQIDLKNPIGSNKVLLSYHPEFSQWAWVEPEQLVEKAVSFKRAIYKAILDEFLPLIHDIKEKSNGTF